MSEGPSTEPETSVSSAKQPAAVATARRRSPKQDAVLARAVDLARRAVVDSAGSENVGEYRGTDVHEDRLLTHLFDCTMAGYPGWTWFAAVARAPRSKVVTVCEVGLMAGEDSLLAPEWVPWEERMRAVAEEENAEISEQSDTDAESPGLDDDREPAGTVDSADSNEASS